jgi:2'-5' RNA ligase
MFFPMIVALDELLARPLAPQVPFKLFFSVFPDPQTAARIGYLARSLRRHYGFKGRPLPTPRFHCTLFSVDDDHDAPLEHIVARAKEAAASGTDAPFRVSFNGVMSFSGKKDHYPLVLVGDDGVVGLTWLRSALCRAVRQVGLRPDESNFTPHVTMLYDGRRIGEQSVEPIFWTVTEIVLVLSLVGRTQYYSLGRWQLRGSRLWMS